MTVNTHPELKGGFCTKKSGKTYGVFQAKAYWNAEKVYTAKTSRRQIGCIKSSDGCGEIIFNAQFLSEHPEFANWRVIRKGKGRNKLSFEHRRAQEAMADELWAAHDQRKSATAPYESSRHGKFNSCYLLRAFIRASLSG